MKILSSKSTIRKIIIAILIVLSFNFISPTFSHADAGETGGVLLGPVIDLLASIADAFSSALQYFMYDGTTSGGGIWEGYMISAEEYNNNKGQYPEIQYNTSGKNKVAPDIKVEDIDRGWLAGVGSFFMGTAVDADNFGIPVCKYSPEKIFAGQVPALDINFINPNDYGNDAMNQKSITRAMQKTIAQWYIALRNLSLVGLLSVLLYVGIRMVISSTASDKAKYKQMLMDWVIALCILFFIHYIMVFTLTITEMISSGIGEGGQIAVNVVDENGSSIAAFNTNLTGYCRFQVQYAHLGLRLIYLMMYIALTVYTVMFTWKYVKRAITMAFLTLIAPVVSLTYPIDKINDGHAQAFNMWLKEYIFNALLQPFHLILYTIFLGSAMDIAVQNPIYAILFLAFITPAEKLLRRFFGFEKATTAGDSSFAGAFGGAAAFNMVKGLVGAGAQRLGNGKGNSKGGNNNNNIRTQNTGAVEDDKAPQGYEAFAGDIRTNENPELEEGQQGQPQADSAMGQYDSEGYGRNANGEYNGSYNPNTDRSYQQAQPQEIPETSNPQPQEISEPLDTQPQEMPEQGQQPGIFGRAREAIGNSAIGRTGARIASYRPIRGAVGAIGGAGRYVGKGLHDRFATREGWAKNARLAGRIARRTITTGAGLAVGLGMGMAGDNLEDVLKYGAAGAALGGTTLDSMVTGAGRAVANSNIVQAATTGAREAYYGGVNEAAVAQQTRQLKESGEIREYVGNNIKHDDGSRLSEKELNAYEDRAIEHYNAGITSNSAIKKTLKLENSIREELDQRTDMTDEDKALMSKQQSQTIAKIADQVDDKKLMTDEKYAQGLQDNFRRGLKKANPELSQKELTQQSDKMMELLKKYKKID